MAQRRRHAASGQPLEAVLHIVSDGEIETLHRSVLGFGSWGRQHKVALRVVLLDHSQVAATVETLKRWREQYALDMRRRSSRRKRRPRMLFRSSKIAQRRRS